MSKRKIKTRYRSSIKGLNIYDGLNIYGFKDYGLNYHAPFNVEAMNDMINNDPQLSLQNATPLEVEGKGFGSLGSALKGGLMSGAFNGVAGSIGSSIGSAIGGGLHSGAGDAIGGLSKVASAIPGPWGAVASAGLGIIGGGVNALIGSKLNQENINAVNSKIGKLNSMTANANSFDTLSNTWGSTDFGSKFSKNYIGKDGAWSNKAKKKWKELREKQELASAYAENTLIDNAENLAETTMNNLEANYAAYGGNLFDNGGPMFNPFTKRWYNPNGSLLGSTKKNPKGKTVFSKSYGSTEYTSDGFAVNYDKKHHEIGRTKGTQTPSIQDSKGRRNVEEQTYFDRDKELSDSVKVISKRYGLNPNLVASRLAREGLDVAINNYNITGGNALASEALGISGPHYGLNDIHTDIQSGLAKIREPWVTYNSVDFTNEKGRQTHSGIFENMGGIISATAAELEGRRNAIKKAHPNMNSTQLDAAASAAFNRGLPAVLSDLKEGSANYLSKYKPFINLKAFGGDLQTHGASFPTGITTIDNGGSHEENPYEGVFMGIGSNGKPNLVEEGETIYDNFVFSDRLTVPQSLRTKYKLRGNKDMTFSDAVKQLSKSAKERPNDPITKDTMKEVLPEFMQAQNVAKDEYNMKNEYSKGGNLFAMDGDMDSQTRKFKGMFESPIDLKSYVINPQGIPEPEPSPVIPYRIDGEYENNNLTSTKKDNNSTNHRHATTSDLRYAPAIGKGLMLLQNIFNKPDYSNANTIYNEANNLGKVNTVGFNPLGNYLTYRPMDRNYYINKMNAESSAARRAIINNSGGNRGRAMAGILAGDYNALGKLGDFARSAEEYNNKQRQDVATFNRGTDQYNSEGALKADMANQAAINNASMARFEGITRALQMRDALDTARNAAIASNYSGLFEDLGNIGIDEYNRADRDWMIRNVYPTLSEKPQEWSDKDWEDYKKGRSTTSNKSSKSTTSKSSK